LDDRDVGEEGIEGELLCDVEKEGKLLALRWKNTALVAWLGDAKEDALLTHSGQITKMATALSGRVVRWVVRGGVIDRWTAAMTVVNERSKIVKSWFRGRNSGRKSNLLRGRCVVFAGRKCELRGW
jgi:hypothetical protein